MEPRDPIAERHRAETQTGTIHLPAPTAWPFLMALGLTLVAASLVTNMGIGALGLLLSIAGAVGWFRDVLPHEAHEDVAVEEEYVALVSPYEKVAHIEVDETHRAQLPLQTFSLGSAIKGGIAGGIAMVIPAEIYGIVRFHSIWYVVNLLGGAGVGGWVNPSVEEMRHFHLSAFITANIIQGCGDAAGGTAVRRHAADVAETSDSAGRHHRAGDLDWLVAQRAGHRESVSGRSH